MNTILVWVLITIGVGNFDPVAYSPQVQDLESCQRLQQAINDLNRTKTKCVQIKVVK